MLGVNLWLRQYAPLVEVLELKSFGSDLSGICRRHFKGMTRTMNTRDLGYLAHIARVGQAMGDVCIDPCALFMLGVGHERI